MAYLNQDNKNVKQAPALSFAYELIVAMMPLLSIQVVGVLFEKHAKRSEANEEVYGDLDIIELWEEAI